MGEHLRNETTRRPVLAVLEGDRTVDQALAMRDDQARLAERCAERVERARRAGRYGAMLRWTDEYRRAAMQCRVLGEQIRRLPRDPTRLGLAAPESSPVSLPNPALTFPPPERRPEPCPPLG
jgi:hypothetical protein